MKLGKIGRTTMGVSFPEEMIANLRALAAKDRRPVGFIIRDACEAYIAGRAAEITALRKAFTAAVGRALSAREQGDTRSIEVKVASPEFEPPTPRTRPPRKLKAEGNVKELQKNEE